MSKVREFSRILKLKSRELSIYQLVTILGNAVCLEVHRCRHVISKGTLLHNEIEAGYKCLEVCLALRGNKWTADQSIVE